MKLHELVLSIPHASTHIPSDIRERMVLSEQEVLQEPDLYTDQIYKVDGPRIVEATVNRIISDVNRAPDEIYTSGRQRSLGVVMLNNSNRKVVFEEDPTPQEMEQWINLYHAPYHKELDEAMQGSKFLIDCHSLWSSAPASQKLPGLPRADIVLGNRLYTTCDARTTLFFKVFFERLGYDVAINDPYTGRYVIGTHCSRLRVPGIQIEIKRSLYMDEETLKPIPEKITRMNNEIAELVEKFCAWEDNYERRGHMCDLCLHSLQNVSI